MKGGRLRLNGRPVKTPMAELRPGDRLELDGVPLTWEVAPTVVLFHKPPGVVTSHARDSEGRPNVFDLVLPLLPRPLASMRWHAVGRLDVDTTGLLLLTNDERVVAHATSPGVKLPKRYVAKVSGSLSPERLAPLGRPMTLGPGITLQPARARVRSADEVELTLTEGKFHQVKRMLGAVGLPVLRLHREAVGTLDLDVAEGALRVLSAEEIRDRLGFSPAPPAAAGR